MADRLVVIGGDAAGMTAATNARRGRPDLEIVVLEKGVHTSYSACGIPYVISGAVGGLDELVVRTPQEFRDNFRIDVRTRHEARSIDLDARRIEVRALDQERTLHIGFDLLHIATGARPARPDLPGIEGPNIYGVQTLDDAQVLLDALAASRRRTVAIVGGGSIGLEMGEAFVRRGARVTVIDDGPQPLRGLDPDLGAEVAGAVRRFGISLRTGTKVEGFAPGKVHTSQGDIEADLVILGLGVVPNSEVGVEAGLDAGAKGALAVDHRQRTSREGIYAAGDCAHVRHQVSGEQVHVALGTVANKTGRVAGMNLGGGYASFPGVLGTAVTRVCDVEIAHTGLNQAEADAAGIECEVGTVEATTRAAYFPGAEPLHARVLVEKGTGRLIGGQLVGADRAWKRIDTLATAITARMTAAAFLDLDLAYAPSVSPMWDAFQLAARSTLG